MANGGSVANASLESVAPVGARLAKIAATVDTLKVSASGFAAKTILLSSYDTTLNVTLTASGGGGDIWGGLKNPAAPSAAGKSGRNLEHE